MFYKCKITTILLFFMAFHSLFLYINIFKQFQSYIFLHILLLFQLVLNYMQFVNL